MGRIRLMGVGVLLLCLGLASPAAAQGPGIFVRAVCTTITGPVVGETWCFDSTAQLLKVWNGATYVGAAGLAAPVLASQGGTGVDTSGSTGVPSVSAGTWSIGATLSGALGGLGATLPASGYLKGGASVVSQAAPFPVADGGTATTLGLRSAPGGRLTLTSASPVMTANVAASTSIYYALYAHDLVPLYDGTVWTMTTFTELTNTTTDNTVNPAAVGASSNYDLFVWNNSGTIRLGRGPAWTSDTARGTGAGTTELIRQNGIWQNKIAITNGPAANRGTYVGTVRSNAGSTIDWHTGAAAAGGTAATLYVWNAYNRVPAYVRVEETTASWTYTSSTWRAMQASNGNRVSVIRGLDEDTLRAFTLEISTHSAVSANVTTGLGLDSTSTPDIVGGFPAFVVPRPTSTGSVTDSIVVGAAAWYAALPGLGFHFLQAIERTSAATATFYSQGAFADTFGYVGLAAVVIM